MTTEIQVLLTEKEACKYLHVSRSFLAQSRSNGLLKNHTPAPPFIRVGGGVRYDIRDLEVWISENRHEIQGGCSHE